MSDKQKCEYCDYWYKIGYGDAQENWGINTVDLQRELHESKQRIAQLEYAICEHFECLAEGSISKEDWEFLGRCGLYDRVKSSYPTARAALYTTEAGE